MNSECARAFCEMKEAQGNAYDAARIARAAEQRWSEACLANAMHDAPELKALVRNVEVLEEKLLKAKRLVKVAATRVNAEPIFKRWYE
jgi:hypothetical protein